MKLKGVKKGGFGKLSDLTYIDFNSILKIDLQ